MKNENHGNHDLALYLYILPHLFVVQKHSHNACSKDKTCTARFYPESQMGQIDTFMDKDKCDTLSYHQKLQSLHCYLKSINSKGFTRESFLSRYGFSLVTAFCKP